MFVCDAQQVSAVVPCVWLARVGVNTIGDELLAVAQHLDLMGDAVTRLEAHRHLLKRRLAAKRDQSLRRHAGAHKKWCIWEVGA